VDALVGIARLAARSPSLEEKRQTEYFELETRRFIGRCSGSRMPFRWTIKPYRGCEFGCKYCYARYAHEFLELRDPALFEHKIYVKRFEPERFRQELKRIPLRDLVWLGTATDPYQPAERRFRVTRRILEVFAGEQGRLFGITTKSDLAVRDVRLLSGIARRNAIQVHLSVTTLDEGLARQIEPLAPRPALRLAAARQLASAGVPVSILSCPVLPLLNDSEASLDAVCAAAAAAGANSFHASPLFLRLPAKSVFLQFIDRNYPAFSRRYHERFDERDYLTGAYPRIIRERVEAAAARHGISTRNMIFEPSEWPGGAQLDLFR
jgi:DNA repair photolyase